MVDFYLQVHWINCQDDQTTTSEDVSYACVQRGTLVNPCSKPSQHGSHVFTFNQSRAGRATENVDRTIVASHAMVNDSTALFIITYLGTCGFTWAFSCGFYCRFRRKFMTFWKPAKYEHNEKTKHPNLLIRPS